MTKLGIAFLSIVLAAGYARGQAPTTYTGTSSNNDYWNDPSKWDNGVPSGAINVIIPSGLGTVCANNNSTPSYTGNLTINANSSVQCGWSGALPGSWNMLGTAGSTTISMYEGTKINVRCGSAYNVPAIQLMGNAKMCLGSSTQPSADPTFAGGIFGAYTFTLQGKGGGDYYLTASNNFGALVTDPQYGENYNVHANVANSLNCGTVTIMAVPETGIVCANLIINAPNVMADSCALHLNGPNSTTRLKMVGSDTIRHLYLDGVRQPTGTYGRIGLGGVNYQVDWMDATGNGVLTVTGIPPLYWDKNGSVGGAGGATPTGTWGVNTYWSASSAGTGGTGPWVADSVAAFAAGSDAVGTYTVAGSGTLDIGGVNFEEGTVTVSGGTLRLTADSYMDVATGRTATVSSVISDDGSDRQLVKASPGTLVLSGANTHTGATKLEGGTLSVSSLANASVPCNIGNYPSSGADGLLLSGGSVEYTGGTVSVDRGLTIAGDVALNVSSDAVALGLGNCAGADVTGEFTVTGGEGSSLTMGQLQLREGVRTALKPTGVSMTVASVQGATSYPNAKPLLTLRGTTSGNRILGNINVIFVSGYTIGMDVMSTGSGEWAIDGNLGASGGLTVNGGTLRMNGTVDTTSTVGVNGGVLGGTGTFNDPIDVGAAGAVAPGHPTGTLTVPSATVAGKFIATIDTRETSPVGTLDVIGTLNITGCDLEVVRNAGSPTEEQIIASYGSLVGTFDTIDGPPGVLIDYAFNGNNIAISLPPSGTILIVK